MRALFVITDRDRRGAQVHACDLAEGMRRGGVVVDTVALTSGEHGDLLDVEALGPSRRSASTLASLRSRAREYDIAVAHGSSTLLACAIGLVGTGTPFVYRQISDPLFWAATPARRTRTALMLRRAAQIVALSDGVGDVFAGHYRLRRDMITTIPNAVSVEDWRVPTSPRDRIGTPHVGRRRRKRSS